MAASFVKATPRRKTTWGNVKVVMTDFTPSTSYPALGEPITPAMFGLKSIDFVSVEGPAANARLSTWDPTNVSLRLWTAIGTEAGTGTDQSAQVLQVMVIGKGY